MNALVAAVEMAVRESASDKVLMFFVDEDTAFRFLAEHSRADRIPFSDDLAPLHKWLQAIYLTNGGAIPISPDPLAMILDVPLVVAVAMLRELASFRAT